MKTLWNELQDDLKVVECEWCGSKEELYKTMFETLCRHCLEETESEELEYLTNEERNK